AILGSHRDRPISRFGVLNFKACREHASNLIKHLDIKAIGPDMVTRLLSGGNQQKIVLGRALERKPRLLIACQPTCGLDVHASAEVHRYLIEVCEQGAGILLISYDLDEVLSLSDRVMVMFRGQIAGILSREEANPEKVGKLMLGEVLPCS
ncbi:MAG: ABC transporter ATP-binding protein, partial [Armatimonadota bacterium]|nr:ABC transporter ATP-binding protein [Armatimonadota bacterium]